MDLETTRILDNLLQDTPIDSNSYNFQEFHMLIKH